MDNAKYRHHFVPRKYLRQWCMGGNDAIAVSIKGKPPFLISVDKVAYENAFYSYEKLTLDDIKSVLKFHPRMVSDDLMRKFFYSTIILPVMYRLVMDPSNNELIEIWRFLGESNLLRGDEEDKINALYSEYLLDKETFIDKKNRVETVGYEDFLARMEGMMWPILAKLLKGHCGFIKNEKLAFRFFFYIVMQRTRSPAFMELAKSDNNILDMPEHMLKSARYRRYVYALDRAIELTMCRSNFTLYLVANTSSLEYVTGDLPVVEISRTEHAADYFFPISPRMAIVLGLSKGFNNRLKWIDPSQRCVIDRLNGEICRQSVRQVYATKTEILSDNNYVAKGELPEIDRQQLVRLKELSDKDEVVSSM